MESNESTFQEFDAYDFDNDKVFQAGLQTLANTSDPAQLLKAKAFYYSRSKAPIDLDAYQRWKSANPDTRPPLRGNEDSKDMLCSPSFAEVVQMIASGKEIPGIRDIPDQLSEEQPSESTLRAPPKPWEQPQE